MESGNLRRRKIFRIILLSLVIIALITGGWRWHQETKPYHFLTVIPGMLYRSGTLKPHNLEKVIDKHGIRTVVSLRLPGETSRKELYAKEVIICRQKGVKLVKLPMLGNTPPTEKQMSQWFKLLDDKERLPILVHCAQGVVRTGMMAAISEIEYLNKHNEKTLSELPMFGHKLYVPKRKRMRQFILNYVPRGERVLDASEKTRMRQ